MKTFSLRIILTLWLMEQRFCRSIEEMAEIAELIEYMTKGKIKPRNLTAFSEMIMTSMKSSQEQLPKLVEQIQGELKKLQSWHNHTHGARRTNALRLWVKRQISLYGSDTVELKPLSWSERRELRRRIAKMKAVRVVEVHMIFG